MGPASFEALRTNGRDHVIPLRTGGHRHAREPEVRESFANDVRRATNERNLTLRRLLGLTSDARQLATAGLAERQAASVVTSRWLPSA